MLSQRWSATCWQSVSPVSQSSSSLFSPQNVALSTSRQAHQGEKKWGKICFKKLPLGPPSLPVIGSYPFLSGPGIERLFGTQVRLRTNAIGSIAVSHTGLLLWPNHRHVHGLLPSRRRERLAACKNPLCKRGVLGQNQVGFIWSISVRNESILCSNYTTNWARSLTGESLGIAMTDGTPLKPKDKIIG